MIVTMCVGGEVWCKNVFKVQVVCFLSVGVGHEVFLVEGFFSMCLSGPGFG